MNKIEVENDVLQKFTKDYREMQQNHKILTEELSKAISLLEKSLCFMNSVPNHKYGDNYKICSEIETFVKELQDKIKDL